MADLARIKRNVSKMVEQGAPATDIDAYITSEGTTVEDIRGASLEASPPPNLYDRIRSAHEAAKPVRQVEKLVEPFSGAILPVSRNRFGDVSLDINAGLPGSIKRSFSLVDEVGRVPMSEDELIARSAELASLALPINPAVRAGDLAIPGVTRAPLRRQTKAPAVPTRQELKQAYKTGKEQAKSLGVDYNVPPVIQMASTVRAKLEMDGLNSVTAPKTMKLLRMLERPPPGSGSSLEGLDTARKAFRNAAKDFTNPAEQAAASRVIEALDSFSEVPPPGSVMGGPLAEARARQAGDVMAEARANYAAGMRSKRFDKKRQAGELNAATANSGMNVENALRQKVKSILLSDKLSAGFTPVELEEMRLFATGKRNSANVRRYVGNLLGGGGGLGQAVVAGGTAALAGGAGFGLAGPAGLAVGTVPAAIGWGLKTSANRVARRGMEELDEMIRKRSPLYQKRLAAPAALPPSRTVPAIGTPMTMATGLAALGPGNPLQSYLSADDPRFMRDPLIRR